MKEPKVYVDELPKSCKTCQFQCYGECRNGCDILKTDYSMTQCHIMRGKYKDCPLIDIKTHDRELVEKVLEKTKTFVRENTYICGGNATREDIITSSSYNQALRDVLDFLGALQKELEK